MPALAALGCASSPDSLFVFAAASLRDWIRSTNELFTASTGSSIRDNIAGSGALAQQMISSSRGDVFVSANKGWMQALEDKGIMAKTSVRPILRNQLVIISHHQSPLEKAPPGDLLRDHQRISIAHPDSVPAGTYAKHCLESLGLWNSLKGRMVYELDVRASLTRAESAKDVISIVYHTDALSSQKVKVVGRFPAKHAPEILYHAGYRRTSERADIAQQYLDHLQSEGSVALAQKLGFLPVKSPVESLPK